MEPRTNILQRGAEDGVVLGCMFICLIFCNMQSTSALLSLTSVVLFFAVPVVNYKMLSRSMRESGGTLPMSALWMEGILGFLGGGLMLAAVVYAFLRWIFPDFVAVQAAAAVEAYRQFPALSEYGDILAGMIERHALPRPIELAMTIAWAVGFSGSILSLLTAVVIRLKTRTRN